MQLRPDQVEGFIKTHHGFLGPGWREVQSFDDLQEEDDEYEYEETEEYVTLDLGGMDPRYLHTEATLQLIGLDTGLPHLKIGNAVLQGEVTPLIGSEVLLGLIRNHENPHNPSHPPVHTTSNRIAFTPIQLWHNSDPNAHILQIQTHPKAPLAQALMQGADPSGADAQFQAQIQTQGREGPQEMDLEDVIEGDEAGETRSMFLQRPAKNGPNRPEVFPGKQRGIIRAKKRAEREQEKERARAGGEQGMSGDQNPESDDGEADEDDEMDVDGGGIGIGADLSGTHLEAQEGNQNREGMGERQMDIDPALMEVDFTSDTPVQASPGSGQQAEQARQVGLETDTVPRGTSTPARAPHPVVVPAQGATARSAPPQPDPHVQSIPLSTVNPVYSRPAPTPATDTSPQVRHQMSGPAHEFTSTPGAGPSTPIAFPSLETQPETGMGMFTTAPRSDARRSNGGRPRTRPLLEIHRADQLAATNLNFLPDNVRILVSPLALGLVPAPSPFPDLPPPVPQSLEFTKAAFRRWLIGSGYGPAIGTPNSSPASRQRSRVPSTPRSRMSSGTDPVDAISKAMSTPGAGEGAALIGETGTSRSRATGVSTPTPAPAPAPGMRSEPFLMTIGADPTPPPYSAPPARAVTATPSRSQSHAGTLPTTGGGVGGPPVGLEPEARKDVESIQDAEAREALRDATEQSRGGPQV